MADDFGFRIHFDDPFGHEALRSTCDALRSAVEVNWSLHRDGSCPPAPDLDENLPAWLEGATPERMSRVPDELEDEATELFTDELIFAFSPLSSWAGLFSATRERDGMIGLSFQIGDGVRYYDPGAPERDGEGLWPTNKECLNRILGTLCSALPVRRVFVNGPLR